MKYSAYPEASPRLEFIDGLRGLAILAVLLRHGYLAVHPAGLPRWADALGLGYLGVHLFLVLSGFCVSWSYVSTDKRLDRADFAWRRATRILPAYYVALALAALLAWPSMGLGALALHTGAHALMLHNLHPDTVLSLYSPMWSLALECQLYLFFPLLLLGFRRAGAALTLLLVLAGQLAFRFSVLHLGTDYTDTTFVVAWSAPGRLLEFGLGMLAAQWVAQGRFRRCTRAQAWSLSAGTLLAMAVGLWLKRRLGVAHPLTDLAWSAAFLGMLLRASDGASLLARALRSAPLTRLGAASYSVYLTHDLTLTPVATALLDVSGAHPLLVAPLALAFSVALSLVFYRLVEQPAESYFRNRRSRASLLSARQYAGLGT